MKKIFLALSFVFSFFIQDVSFSQLREELKTEILAFIQKEAMEFPESEKTPLPFQVLSIQSGELQDVFVRYKVMSIAKAFPDFMDRDTIVKDDFGNDMKIPQFSRIYRIKILSLTDVDNAIEALSNIKGVIYAEKNSDIYPVNDPGYPVQWHLKNTGQNGGTPGSDIKAELAWQIFTGSPSIKIGIVDSGILTNHEDLNGKSSGDYTSSDYHGTHVAGIAGAIANNYKGGRGVDWNAHLYSQKIFNPDFVGDAEAANKIINAVNSGCHILNNSWGGPDYSLTIRLAFTYAYKMNRVSVVAMGNNNGNQTQYPAGYGQGIITVGSTNRLDRRSSFSNTGNHIDVSAPGEDIYSTFGPSVNSYGNLSGTSMASPVVTGIGSLLKGYNQNLYNDDIENILKLSAEKKGTDPYVNGWNDKMGFGRVNAYNAIKFLNSPYSLNHYSSSGGSDVGSTGHYQMPIIGASGLATGIYLVKRHEVHKTVTFPGTINAKVWGRGVATTGWSAENPNTAMGFCDVVSGSVTGNSAVMRTFVYEVWTISGSYAGWYPCQPNAVNYAYTVLGESMVAPAFSSYTQYPNPLSPSNPSGYVYMNLSQGNGSMNFQWDTAKFKTNKLGAEFYNANYAKIWRTQLSGMMEDQLVPEPEIKSTASNGAGSVTGLPSWKPRYSSNPPYSCPTIAFYEDDGTEINENTILNQSLNNPDIDITDYYILQNPFLQEKGEIVFSIKEPENKITYLDQLALLQVAVEKDEFAAVTDDGDIISYRLPSKVSTATIDGREDVSEMLASYDNQTLEVSRGTYLTVKANDMGDEVYNPYLVIRPIIAVAKDSPAGAITLSDGEYRQFYSKSNDNIICIKLTEDMQNVEIYFDQTLFLDQVMVVNGEINYSITDLAMTAASHSVHGNMRRQLGTVNGDYCIISSGQEVSLNFLNMPSDKKHVYILKSTGRYTEGFSDPGIERPGEIANKLMGNFPNPFNPVTTIKYSLNADANVRISVYDLSGRLMKQLANEVKSPGEHSVIFDGSSLASGVYFYKMEITEQGRTAPYFTETKRMMLIK